MSIEQGKLREDLAKSHVRIAEVQKEVETQADLQYPPESGRMNYTKRARVLRLHKRGDRADQIAAILHLPQNEVALLVKLDQMTGGPAV